MKSWDCYGFLIGFYVSSVFFGSSTVHAQSFPPKLPDQYPSFINRMTLFPQVNSTFYLYHWKTGQQRLATFSDLVANTSEWSLKTKPFDDNAFQYQYSWGTSKNCSYAQIKVRPVVLFNSTKYLGTEVVEGILCDKWHVTAKSNNGNMMWWQSTITGYPVRNLWLNYTPTQDYYYYDFQTEGFPDAYFVPPIPRACCTESNIMARNEYEWDDYMELDTFDLIFSL